MSDNGHGVDGHGSVPPPVDRVAVVGVGRIGVHRAVTLAETGLDVVGYDVDEARIAAYRRGRDPTATVGDHRLAAAGCSFTTDPTRLADADVVFVAVPTRHDPDAGEPDATLRSVAETVGANCSPRTTVVLESTVAPGTTAELFTPAVEAAAEGTHGAPVDVAYAPERFSKGRDRDEWRSEPRVVGATDPAVAAEVAAVYERVYDTVHVVEGPAIAEAAKCVENVYRDATIAVVNELASGLTAMGVDADSALAAAATKGNVPDLEPGIVGGQCLPEDPLLLADRAAEAGASMPLVRTARAVNDGVVDRVVDTTVAALAERDSRSGRNGSQPRGTLPPIGHGTLRSDGAGGAVPRGGDTATASTGSEATETVLLVGLAYKPGVSDLAGSRCGDVATRLTARGLDVVGYDPFVDPETAEQSLPFPVRSEAPFSGVDGVVVLVAHSPVRELTPSAIASAAAASPVIVDLPRVFDRSVAARSDVVYRCP